MARPVVGLTLYLDEPLRWARQGASAALQWFLDLAHPRRLGWFSTSAMNVWDPVGENTLDRIAEALPLPWQRASPRHCFELRLVDDPSTPSLAFHYREIDEARRGGVGWLQVLLPDNYDPDELLRLAIDLGDTYPFLAGVGGFAGAWNPGYRATSFRALRPWCRRYLGLDVQDPDAMGWHVRDALPGTNWLTMLGPALRDALPPAADLALPWREDVSVIPLAQGTLVRAGAQPTLGDTNLLTFPAAYAEVARRLAPLLPKDPPEFPQWDAKAKETAAWMRRFIEPEGWS